MDKNKKTIVKFWCIILAPLALSLFLMAVRCTFVPRCPLWVPFIPLIIQLAMIALIAVLSFYLSWNYKRKHRKKCCGTCVHCPDDVDWKFKSRCLRDGHEIERPGKHSCKHFFGSVTKDYLGPLGEPKKQ